ncbi:MAG: N-acetylmuramoyl-L-alanine amidase [Alphaproteobacteria bacterium]|nr:N-acetylmuramoyl-L-alanine amidase [Alphaproteobacteria bacterium]
MSRTGAKKIDRWSPNHGPRVSNPVDILLLHYTGMERAADALDRLTDAETGVSAHYMIDEDGTVYRLVAEERRAWHAGRSCWAGEADINSRSIGIELVNPGHEFGYRPFPQAQIAALIDLAGEIIARHPIPRWRVLGHSDVAPSRKLDPGEMFDWPGLAAAGIGVWPQDVDTSAVDLAAAADDLAAFGYCMSGGGDRAQTVTDSVVAFQRHYRPRRIDGEIDGETAALARAVVGMMD